MEIFDVLYCVIRSLMPKGVEHWFICIALCPCLAVIRSLMPKGVEHTEVLGERLQVAGCDSIFDAERR